jgi:hypothetical protein
MRKTLFRASWALLIALPVIYGIQIYITQDLPDIQIWKWAILFGSVVVIYFSRNTDDVLKHHLA